MRDRQREHSPEYRQRIGSKAWRDLRRKIIREVDFRCERCRRQIPDFAAFELHHLTYDRLGHERREDLQLVCKPCHSHADREREARVRREAGERRWSARLDGWATKVYGEGWWRTHDEDDVEEAFEDWLERRR